MHNLLQKKIIYLFLGIIVIVFVILVNLPKSSPTDVIEQPLPIPTTRPARQQETIHTDEEPYVITPNPIYLEKLQREPFWNELPYWTERYKIEYRDSADIILIHLFLPENASNAEKNALQVQYRDEALNWLRSNGARLQTLNIQYRIYE